MLWPGFLLTTSYSLYIQYLPPLCFMITHRKHMFTGL
nr:MAG TPA: hypothetical protein [Bacteriophage sp.]